MKFCTNPRCEGACVYEGVSSISERLTEFYRCLRCFTLHKVEAKSAIMTDQEQYEWLKTQTCPIHNTPIDPETASCWSCRWEAESAAPLLTGDEDTERIAVCSCGLRLNCPSHWKCPENQSIREGAQS